MHEARGAAGGDCEWVSVPPGRPLTQGSVYVVRLHVHSWRPWGPPDQGQAELLAEKRPGLRHRPPLPNQPSQALLTSPAGARPDGFS